MLCLCFGHLLFLVSADSGVNQLVKVDKPQKCATFIRHDNLGYPVSFESLQGIGR